MKILKQYLLVTIATTLLILVNILGYCYYWHVFIILAIAYYFLFLFWLLDVVLMLLEKFSNQKRIYSIVSVALILSVIYYFPFGIPFDSYLSKDDSILIAHREGVANCRTTLKLKSDQTFVEYTICFGFNEIHGKYQLVNDTLLFYDVLIPKTLHEEEETYYKLGIIKRDLENTHQTLQLLKDKHDNDGYAMYITKNIVQY